MENGLALATVAAARVSLDDDRLKASDREAAGEDEQPESFLDPSFDLREFRENGILLSLDDAGGENVQMLKVGGV